MDTQSIHGSNQKRWDAAADNWAKAADSRAIWNNCHKNPELVFCKRTLDHLNGVEGLKIAVLGSGDNEAVFALAGMGAIVTSTDISQNQLEHARKRSIQLGLDIDFIRQDVVKLDKLSDDTFDIVYTGGHVAVWVADLQSYYNEAVRILKPGGKYIVEEYHPFRRVWKESKTELKVGYKYFNRGPFMFEYNNNVLYPEKGQYQAHEFHWTISDFCNAILKAGARIEDMYEYGDTSESWEVADMHGLPEIFSVVGIKG